jgi:hypothetical protein
VLPFAIPPASANTGEGDDAKLPPSGNTLMPGKAADHFADFGNFANFFHL